MQDCIFCKIIAKELPCNLIAETENVVAFKDINPKAAVHYLIVPKKHVKDVASLQDQDKDLLGEITLLARDLSKKLSGSQAFRLITNNGSDAGQCIFHLHFHFLAGSDLPGF